MYVHFCGDLENYAGVVEQGAMVSSEYIHAPCQFNALQLLSVLNGRAGGLFDAPSCGPSPHCRTHIFTYDLRDSKRC